MKKFLCMTLFLIAPVFSNAQGFYGGFADGFARGQRMAMDREQQEMEARNQRMQARNASGLVQQRRLALAEQNAENRFRQIQSESPRK